MPHCINPNCQNPKNPEHQLFCQSCNSELLIEGIYRVTEVIVIKEYHSQLISKVFRAIDNEKNKVVLKVLYSRNSTEINLFEREISYLKQLEHSGLPKIVTNGTFQHTNTSSFNGLRYLVMENIEGLNLYEYLNKLNRPIDEKTAINWLKQLVIILVYLHQKDIIHRDIKPANIMIQNGNIILIDLGASRSTDTDTFIRRQLAGELTIVSSVGYTAPEQENGQACIQSDFFSLGRTFMHLLTKKSAGDLPENSLTRQIIWRDRVDDLSPKLFDLIERMMKPDPKDRPQTAQEILDALNQIQTPPSFKKINEIPVEVVGDSSNELITSEPLKNSVTQTITDGLDNTQFSRWVVLPSLNQINRLPFVLGLLSFLLLGYIAWRVTVPGEDKGVQSPQANPTSVSPNTEYDPIAICRKRRQNPPTDTRQPNQCFHDVIQSLTVNSKIRYGGSTSWVEIRDTVEPAIETNIKGIDFQYIPPKIGVKPGSNEGIQRLLQGGKLPTTEQLDIALSSRFLTELEKQQGLKQEIVASDAIVIAVNPRLDVKLTTEQLEKIYTGQITNWREIKQEYPDLPIEVFSRDPKFGGTPSVFIQEILKGRALGTNVIIVEDLTDGLRKIKQTSGGIFYGSAAEIVHQCSIRPIPIANTSGEFVPPYDPEQYIDLCRGGKRNHVNMKAFKENKYPLIRPLSVIIDTRDPEKEEKGEQFVYFLRTDEGQQLIEQAGHIPLK